MGQELFLPAETSAGGPAARTWLTTRTIVARANFATALVEGELGRVRRPRPTFGRLARDAGRAADLAEAVGFYNDLLLGGRAPASHA